MCGAMYVYIGMQSIEDLDKVRFAKGTIPTATIR